jgi:ERCC4-type nuclease
MATPTPKKRTVDTTATAKNRASNAAAQVKSNMNKGRPINDAYTMSNTAKQRTSDLNKLNDASKTAGRAKNVENKMSKAKPAQPNKVEKLIQDVTNRYRVTAREARDIITAVGTVANLATNKKSKTNEIMGVSRTKEVRKAVGNVAKQISETAKAAKTGKSGTTSGKLRYGTNDEGTLIYGAGNKRK